MTLPSTPPTSPSRARGPVAFAALRHQVFRGYFATTSLWMVGDNVEHVITYWILFQAFQSPMLAGFAVIAHWLPSLLFSVHLGAIADRHDCRRIIQVSLVFMMSSSIAWGLLFLTGNLEPWHAVVLLLVHGFSGAIAHPASQMLIHDMVGKEHLQSAIRIYATERQLAIVVGPAIGAGLLLTVGPAWGLLLNALIYLPLGFWLLTIRHTGHGETDPSRIRRREIRWGEALHTLRGVSDNRVIVGMVALAGLSALMIGSAFQAQMPEYAHHLGTDEVGLAYSALLAANAAGAVLGGLALESRGLLRASPQTAVACAAVWCLAMGGFALTRSYPVALALLFIAGVVHLAFNAMAQTLVQLEAPAERRGRVLGLFNMAQQGLRVGSGVTIGVVGHFIGIHWSLALSAAILFMITMGLLGYVSSGKQTARTAEAEAEARVPSGPRS